MENLVHVIENRLKNIFNNDNNYNEFMNTMKDSKAIISGSFILECIYNQEWNDADIDIFVSRKIKINKNELSTNDRPSSILDKWFSDKYGMKDYDACVHYGNDITRQNVILWVRKYIINGKEFQIITLDMYPSKIQSFIEKNFDFDICKNTYCPLHNKISIFDTKCLEDKECAFNYTVNCETSKTRAKKYEARGFKIIYPKNMKLLIKN